MRVNWLQVCCTGFQDQQDLSCIGLVWGEAGSSKGKDKCGSRGSGMGKEDDWGTHGQDSWMWGAPGQDWGLPDCQVAAGGGSTGCAETISDIGSGPQCLPIAIKQWHGGSIRLKVHIIPSTIGMFTNPWGVDNSSNTSVGPTPMSTPIFLITATLSPGTTNSQFSTGGWYQAIQIGTWIGTSWINIQGANYKSHCRCWDTTG